MYFTDNKKLQRFEHDMKIVPNFERKEVWEYEPLPLIFCSPQATLPEQEPRRQTNLCIRF